MKAVKYLFVCLMETLDTTVFFTQDFLVGFIQIIVYIAVDVFAEKLTNEYYAILITLGFILAFYGVVCIIELFVMLIKRLFEKK